MSTDDKNKTNFVTNILPWFSLIASMVTILGVFSLYRQVQTAEKNVSLLAQQLKTSEENVRIGSLGHIYSQMLEIDKLFAENPELRLYIYYNKKPEEVYFELLNSKDSKKQQEPKGTDLLSTSVKSSYERTKNEAEANAAGELMLDFFALVMLELPNIGQAAKPWERYIKDIYKCSPVMQAMYKDKYAWWDMELPSNLFKQAQNELSSTSPTCSKFK